MTFDQGLSRRIRVLLGSMDGLEEKKMFGGVGFLLNGNMVCGVNRDNLVLRLAPERAQAALAKPHVQPFTMGGRSMAGWIVVTPEGCRQDKDLKKWVQESLAYIASFPPK
jgi:TfoX/Sxy family transcriptional regulator of competence genes